MSAVVQEMFHIASSQLLKAAVSKLFGCLAKFSILSATAGRCTLSIEKNKKNKQK